MWHYLGRYGVLLIGAKGEGDLATLVSTQLQAPESIIYLSVYSENEAQIKEYEKDPGNECLVVK